MYLFCVFVSIHYVDPNLCFHAAYNMYVHTCTHICMQYLNAFTCHTCGTAQLQENECMYDMHQHYMCRFHTSCGQLAQLSSL